MGLKIVGPLLMLLCQLLRQRLDMNLSELRPCTSAHELGVFSGE
jgi:hypothetical protein